MQRTYSVLARWHKPTQRWSVAYGDWSWRVVEDEWRDEYKGDGEHYRIISVSGPEETLERAIDAALANESPP